MEELFCILVLTLFTIPYWVENRRIRRIMKGETAND